MRRTVNFNVNSAGEVDKRIPQYGGVRGEHHATEIVFTMSATAPYRQGDLVRLRFTGGDGAVLSSDLVDDVIVQGERMLVSYSLPSVLTQTGGQLGVRVVFSSLNEDGKETETFLTDEAVLYFEDNSSENGTPFWTGVSEMLKRTTTASDAASSARDAARDRAEEAAADAQRASRFAQAAGEQALAAVSSEKNAQLYASAALAHRNDAEAAASLASEKAQEIAATGGRIDRLENDLEITQAVSAKLMVEKLSKSGHEPNRYLGTDESGAIVAKKSPEGIGGGATDEQVKEAVEQYLLENPPAGNADGLRIKGVTDNFFESVTQAPLEYIQATHQKGDVWLCRNQDDPSAEYYAYVWTGNGFVPLGAKTVDDISHLSDAEHYRVPTARSVAEYIRQYVSESLHTYDTEVMALLGGDGE